MARTCEPSRTSSDDEDLRWRMVWQREVLQLTLDKIAKNLCVDISTVHRIVRRFSLLGTVDKKPYSTRGRPSKLSMPVQLTILHLIMEKPGVYLWEIQQELQWQFDLEISASVLCTFLKKNGITRKKMQLIALQRDQELRAIFMSEVSLYHCQVLIFIDETGCDRRDALRKYGYGGQLDAKNSLYEGSEYLSLQL